ncbi:hypothetical protein CYMTET_9879 [Cymbomonas tetramitiformis]|uniref:Uncharacterized protein n=1 Tax=Cymbomonas tetramitiformis TaxID=36881 RepID=A0AAE0LEP6_9CHLO|nr:hypothetical protein CYMTET_9879 [Cymbomonas tetramitiformis]
MHASSLDPLVFAAVRFAFSFPFALLAFSLVGKADLSGAMLLWLLPLGVCLGLSFTLASICNFLTGGVAGLEKFTLLKSVGVLLGVLGNSFLLGRQIVYPLCSGARS